MGLEAGTYVSDLVASNPVGATDQKAQGDDHLRLIKSVLQSTFPNASKAFRFPQVLNKSADYSMLVGDDNSLVLVDSTGATRTISLPNTGTITAGYRTTVFKSVAANTIVIDTPGAETINGAASLTLNAQYEYATFEFDGTNWFTVNRDDYARILTTANTFTANQTLQLTDAGATSGPTLSLDRNSASPAASDNLGIISFLGRDSGAASQEYANMFASITDPTAASEDGLLNWQTVVAGTLATRMSLGAGLIIGSPTGGDQGPGSVNASGFYDDGVQVVIPKRALYQNQQNSGTTGPGAFTSGAWRTYPLTTEVYDPSGIGSLASNQVTLAAGTYKTQFGFVLYPNDSVNMAVRLRDVTNNVDLARGTNCGYTGSASGGQQLTSLGSGEFTLAGSAAVELQVYPDTTNSNLATAVTSGSVEVYCQLYFEKVS